MKTQNPRAVISIAGALLIGVTILVGLRLFFFNYKSIPQNGMYPGMPAGSWLITRRNPYRGIHEVGRGDVVVFKKGTHDGDYQYIWRVVGLPGDLVEVANEAVNINGQALKHETVRKEGQYLIVREWNGDVSYEIAFDQTQDRSEPPPITTVRVPGDHLFLLGDNRYAAEDSTFVGPIPFGSIIEKKIF